MNHYIILIIEGENPRRGCVERPPVHFEIVYFQISWIGYKVRAKICGNWIDMQTLLLVTTDTLMKRCFREVDRIGTFSFSSPS